MNAEIERLSKKITPERYAKMLRVLDMRTRKLAVVLEDVYQPHNAAAVLRSCDAFGIQDAYFIENKYLDRISGSVDTGASKWLTLRRYVCAEAVVPKNGISKKHIVSRAAEENTARALRDLRSRGYRIAAAALRSDAVGLEEIPVDRPLALLIGTERMGLSAAAQAGADCVFSLPMAGFVQSFNLSVFSALCMSVLSSRMRAFDDSWKLSEAERDEILLNWLSRA